MQQQANTVSTPQLLQDLLNNSRSIYEKRQLNSYMEYPQIFSHPRPRAASSDTDRCSTAISSLMDRAEFTATPRYVPLRATSATSYDVAMLRGYGPVRAKANLLTY